MKILHIVPYYKPAYIYGGPIASVSKLCETEKKLGVDVVVLTTNANGRKLKLDVVIEKAIDLDGVKVVYFNSLTNDNTFISVALWKYLFFQSKNFDIIHIHTWWNFLVLGATAIARLKGKKVVLSPRGMLSNYILNSSNSLIKKVIHAVVGKRLLKTTIYNATSVQEQLECESLIPGWKGFCIPNILDLPDNKVVKTSNDVFTISYLSRIDRKKGLEVLIKSMTFLDFDVILRISGSGEESYVAELKGLVKQLNLEHKILWVGWQDSETKYSELMNADLFALTSKNENFANVVVEALSVGTPVLISEFVGISAFVEEYDLGWVVPLDALSISGAIKDAKSNGSKIQRIEKSASAIVKTAFSPMVVGAEYLSEYQKVLVNTL